MSIHTTAFPFDLASKCSGGLPSVFIKESATTDKDITFITTDSSATPFNNARIIPANITPTTMNGDLFNLWFGNGYWPVLHSDAHTTEACDPDALKRMYGKTSADIADVIKVSNACDLTPGVNFNQAFEAPISAVKDGVFNWQDYFFSDAMLRHADELRTKHVLQTFHLHTSVPNDLEKSILGQQLLTAISKMDVVYVHTDLYVRRLASQLEKLQLQVPEIKRFDLGVDQTAIKESLEIHGISKTNFLSTIPNYQSLTPGRKAMIEEIFLTQGVVPHRFICADRIDPGKGLITLLKSVDTFLDNQLKSGVTTEQLREKYRFFFLIARFEEELEPTNLKNCYHLATVQLIKELQSKEQYRGVLWFSEQLDGEQRIAVPALMKECTGMTGGAQDGLNLSIMENLLINAGENTSAICGTGAGFAIQSKSEGLDKVIEMPQANNVLAFTQAIESVCEKQKRRLLVHQKAPIIDAILNRNDSVLVTE